jgi:hypothetical protein
MIRKLTLIILLTVCQPVVNAQSGTTPDLFAGFQGSYGFIIPHSKSIEPISHTKPYGFEINLNRIHISENERQIFNANWSSGIQAGYFSFQNPEVLGSAFTLTFYTEPVVAFGKRLQFTIRTGTGLSYHTKIYDEISNPSALFFSTRVSFPMFVSARFKYKTGNHVYITLTGCYNHISNGGFKLPNKGMNFPMLAGGLEYFPKKIPVLEHVISEPGIMERSIKFILQLISSVKLIGASGNYPEKYVFVYGMNARIAKPLTRVYTLSGGVEAIFDGYIKETIKREESGLDYKRLSVTAGQDFVFGKLHFSQHFGYYLYSPYKAKKPVYQKYELTYNMSHHILAGVFLKAHLQDAELMGISLSWEIGNRQQVTGN